MPTLMPITNKSWIWKNCRQTLRKSFSQPHRLLTNLPTDNIEPEHMVDIINVPVELMLTALMHGAWTRDWMLYARYAIANRLLNRENLIFTEPLQEIKPEFLHFQRYGGDFAAQKRLRNVAARLAQHPLSTNRERAGAKLLLSTLDDIQVNSVIQPFHWIRTCVGLSETNPEFGMSLVAAEVKRQKITLCRMLRS